MSRLKRQQCKVSVIGSFHIESDWCISTYVFVRVLLPYYYLKTIRSNSGTVSRIIGCAQSTFSLWLNGTSRRGKYVEMKLLEWLNPEISSMRGTKSKKTAAVKEAMVAATLPGAADVVGSLPPKDLKEALVKTQLEDMERARRREKRLNGTFLSLSSSSLSSGPVVVPVIAAPTVPTVPVVVAPTLPAVVAPTVPAVVAPTIPAVVAPTIPAAVAPTVPAVVAVSQTN